MTPSASPTPDRLLLRLARRLAAPAPAGWTPPPLPDLIARIDRALAERAAAAAPGAAPR